jgi:hypothetical protein
MEGLKATIPNKNRRDQKQLENVVYFNYFGSTITNDARYTCEIKSRIAMAKAASIRRRLFSPANWT